MKSIFIILIVIFSTTAVGQEKCDIKSAYVDFFSVDLQVFGDRTFFTKMVNKVDKEHCFAHLNEIETYYFDYLLTNFSNHSFDEELKNIADSSKRQAKYISTLQNDTLFNDIMSHFSNARTETDTRTRDTLTFDQLLNYAVKFFLIKDINENGHYLGKICVGINGIALTGEERNAHVEAFCFSTILSHYEHDDYNMQDELVNGIKEVYKINLGTKNEDRLLRAQGALFMSMRHNLVLRELLLKEYQDKKSVLPFIISDIK